MGSPPRMLRLASSAGSGCGTSDRGSSFFDIHRESRLVVRDHQNVAGSAVDPWWW